MSLHTKIQDISTKQKAILVRRDAEIEGVWLTLLAGEHGFLFGPPGVAKSLIVEDTARYFTGSRYFSHLMGKHTVPEELFGPVSISKLREDKFEFNIEGYLPGVDLAFLDEGFKANSAILNSLLRLMNERKFRNGTTLLDVPLKSMFIASNEIPTEAELAALYDRILFRFNVSELTDPLDVKQMLTKEQEIRTYLQTKATISISPKEFEKIRKEVDAVSIPALVLGKIVDIRDELLMEHQITISSRRWLKILQGVRAQTYYKGRKEATTEDLSVLTYMLWSQVSELPNIRKVVWASANPFLFKLHDIRDTISILLRDIENANKRSKSQNESTMVLAEYTSKINTVLSDINQLTAALPEYQKDSLGPKLAIMTAVLTGQKIKLSHVVAGINPHSILGAIPEWKPELI